MKAWGKRRPAVYKDLAVDATPSPLAILKGILGSFLLPPPAFPFLRQFLKLALNLAILLPLPPQCWDYCMHHHGPDSFFLFSFETTSFI
jgi:hypothetical protein